MRRPPADTNERCVRRHFEELWNKGHIETIDEFFSAEFVNFGLRYSDAKNNIQHDISVWRTAFPDIRYSIDAIVGSDDLIMCEVTVSGTHRGDFLPVAYLHSRILPPNGRKFVVSQIHRFRLEEGKIVEHFVVRDDLRMFRQLGHLPPV